MAEQTVEIENVGGTGVASEVTLERVAKAVEKMAGIKSKGQAAENKLRELHNKAQQSGVKVVKDSTKALDKNTEAVDSSTSAFNNAAKGALGLAAKGFGTLLGSATGLAKELVTGGNRVTDFAQHIPLVGSHLAILTGFMDNTVDQFRSLTAVGVDFGGSLFEVQNMAAKSGLSLETFSSTIRNNSADLALFAGGAREGAKRFTQISGQLQKQFGPQFSALGLTMEETAEYTADYIKLQTRLGRSQQMSDTQIAQGTAAYTMQLDRLAKITGKQRDEIAAGLEKESLDARMKAVMATMGDTARANLTGVTQILEAASPQAAEAVREMVATGGVPISDFGKDLVRLNPNLAAMSRGLRDGTVTQDEYLAEVRKTAEMANNLTDEQKKQYATMAGLGSAVGSAAIEFMGLQNVGAGSTDALIAQQKAAKRGSAGLLDFERRITQARNIIIGALIDSGVFESLETVMADIINYFTSEDGIAKMKETVEKIAVGIKDFLALVQDKGLFGAIGEKMGDALKSALTSPAVLTAVGGAFALLLGGAAIKSAVTGAIGGLFSGGGGGGGGGKGSGRGRGGGVGKGAGSAVGNFVGSMGAGVMKGAATGLAAFANPQILVGAGILAGSITAIGAGIAGAAWLLGKSLPTFVDGLKSFEDIDGTALSTAATGMLDLSLGMAAFGAGTAVAGLGTMVGGITEGIGKLFGADDPLTKLKKFSDTKIDAAQVKSNAEAMKDFSDAMGAAASAPGESITKAIGSSIAGFFGAEGGIPYDQIKEFEKHNFDAAKIKLNSEALVAFTDALASSKKGEAVAGAGNAVGAIGNAIAGFFGGESGIPYKQISDFETYTFDSVKIKANAEAMVAFNQALTSSASASSESGIGNAVGAIGNAIASFFGGSTPFDKVKEFGDLAINAAGVEANASAMGSFATAMSAFSGSGIENVSIPKALVDRMEDMAAITGTGFTTTAEGLTALTAVPGLAATITSLNSLDATDVLTYNEAMKDLVEVLGELNTELGKDNKVGFGTGTNAGDVIGKLDSIGGSSSGSNQALNQLNSTMQQVLTVLEETYVLEEKQNTNIKGLNGNLIRG